jgi:hypothetical protein
VLELGVYDAVAHFNMGSKAAIGIISELGFISLKKSLERLTIYSLRKLIIETKLGQKKRRKVLRSKKGSTYEAGAF